MGTGPAGVSAPGTDLFSTAEVHPTGPGPGNYVSRASGSGYAAAYVAGAAAVLLSADRKLTPVEAGNLLVSKGQKVQGQAEPRIDPVAALDATLPVLRLVRPKPGGSLALEAGVPIACLLIVMLAAWIWAVRRRRATKLALTAILPSSWDQSW
jgi:subtilisin family serine protease